MAPTSIMPAWFANALHGAQAGDFDTWMKIYAADAVHEFPLASPGAVRSLVGRDAIAAHMRQLPTRIRFGSFHDVRVREVGSELIIETTGHHRRLPGDTPLDISYVWFITHCDGHVTHFRDYMNPLQSSAG